MIISNFQGMRVCPYSFLKTKNNNQPSFKSNVVTKNQNQSMTQEQKTWLGVGLTTVAAIAIGLIVWACSKGKKTNEIRTPQIKSAESQKVEIKPRTNEISQTVDKTTVKIKEQFKKIDDKMQKHFINVSLKQYNPKWDMVKTIPNVLADFEPKNDFSLYEQMVLVPQLLGIKRPLNKNAIIKETFVEYLKLRSGYFDKNNDFDVVRSEVLKDPSDDVVDAEALRLHMLANNTRQFLYSDESVEEPHEMVKFVQPLLIANYTVKMLEEFKPKKENLSKNEKKYFEYMNKLGKFWHERLKKEANEKLPNFVKIITGEIEAPKCYTKGQEEIYDKRYIFYPNLQQQTKLTDVLSYDAQDEYDKYKCKYLRSKITKLEANFIDLKKAVDKNDYVAKNDAKKEITKLIPKVLV